MKDIRIDLAKTLVGLKKIEDEIKPPPELRLTSADQILQVLKAETFEQVADAVPFYFKADKDEK